MKHLYPLAIATVLLLLLLVFTLSCNRRSASVVTAQQGTVAAVAASHAVATARDSVITVSRDTASTHVLLAESVDVSRDSAGRVAGIKRILSYSSLRASSVTDTGVSFARDTIACLSSVQSESASDCTESSRSSSSPSSRLLWVLLAALAITALAAIYARRTAK